METANFLGTGSGKRVPLPLGPFISKVENLNVVQFFFKYLTNSKGFIDHHLQSNIFKGLWFTWIRAAPPLTTQR